VGVVQPVGVRLQRRDALLLEARPELAHQPLSARVEQETHGERHATQHSTPYRHRGPVTRHENLRGKRSGACEPGVERADDVRAPDALD